MALYGCDTFVVLPPLTSKGEIIFGKNSDRPQGEVQEVVYYPNKTYKAGETLQCTYITMDQVLSTNAVLLSKPAWMWGAEMGANNFGVVIGNEAVFTVIDDESHKEKLLGMDLLRLALERSSCCIEAVDIITTLLEKFGQGGPCSDTDSGLLYHNSFLIVDQMESWVLETAGKLWAAEKITTGYRNISNCLSIGSNITKKSNNLLGFAKEKGWDGNGEFNFKDAFSAGGCPREATGRNLLSNLTADRQFSVQRMFQILRDKDAAICRPADDPFHTSGSWVSAIGKGLGQPHCHWVTGTPDPSESLFKPFIFCDSPNISLYLVSPVFHNDPAKAVPRFQYKVDRRHELYKLHESALKKNKNLSLTHLKNAELKLLEESNKIVEEIRKGTTDINSSEEMLKNAVELEVETYKIVLH